MILVTDWAQSGGTVVVAPEDVWSCSEPDKHGRVRAVVNFHGKLLLVEGRRIFEVPEPEARA